MTDHRPKNLNLFTIRQPVPAIVSILHRISGFILFLVTPFVLWGLYLSLYSLDTFDAVHRFMMHGFIKFILWGTLTAFFYHFFAGIRHLLMDMHIGEKLHAARIMAFITIGLGILSALLLGIWLW